MKIVIARSEATKQSKIVKKMFDKYYYVYIMTNKNNTVIYTGETNNLNRRITEHKNKSLKGFTKKYNINKLVYYETFNDINSVILREKDNQEWNDLFK